MTFSFFAMQYGRRSCGSVHWFTWGLSCRRWDDWKTSPSSFFPDLDDDPGRSRCMISRIRADNGLEDDIHRYCNHRHWVFC
jgi:hypothetical protein